MKRKPTNIRQAEIKRAVLSIIKRDGLKNMSTKNLAKETGISEGAIFRHFSSKKEIISSIIEDVKTDLLGNLRKIAVSDALPPERLYKLLCATITYLTENNGITILLFSEASHDNDREMLENLSHIFNTQRQLVSKIILDGISEGIWDESASVEDLSKLYMGIPITLNIELILNKETFHKEHFCRRMTNLIERALKKS